MNYEKDRQRRQKMLENQARERQERWTNEARERQERWDNQVRESQKRYDDINKNREKAYQEDQKRRSKESAPGIGRILLDPFSSKKTSTEEVISPAEATRRGLMKSLPIDKQRTLQTCNDTNVRNFIATVQKTRVVRPDIGDWDIYVAYRRTIETENPDRDMVEKTQIAGILLEGTRKEAKFTF